MPDFEKLSTFREYSIIQQLRVSAGQSDIFAVRKSEDGGDAQSYLLKLYRFGSAMNEELLGQILSLGEKHPENLIRMYDCGFDEETGRYFEIQEFIPYGSLNRIIAVMTDSNRDPAIKSVIRQTISGLKTLHGNNILHLDLKPSNILIRSNKPFNLVLTDFGLSSIIDRDASKKMSSVNKGTDDYRAPEAYSGIYHKKTDYWSLGIIIYELLLGASPFAGKSPAVVMSTVMFKNIEISDKIDKKYIPLLKGLLTKDLNLRWGFDEVSRWLAGEDVEYESETRYKNPYKFNKNEYYTLKELFAAFNSGEKNMKMARVQLSEGFLIQWLKDEKDFDAATEIKLVIDDCNNDFGAALSELIRIYNPSGAKSAAEKNKSEIDELLESLIKNNESEKKENTGKPPLPVPEPAKKESSEEILAKKPRLANEDKEPAPGQPLSVDLGGGVAIELVRIPPGTFQMGSPESEEDRSNDEKLHTVTIAKGYWMDKYPVTQAQWRKVMGNNPSAFQAGKEGIPPGTNTGNHPVEQVSWEDCQEFIKKLNELVKSKNTLPSNSGAFRLPTEAEWEYACRAGTQTRFYWGDDPDYKLIGDYAWYYGNSDNKTHPVGSVPGIAKGMKVENAFGLYDMSGNVLEWCSDWHGDYTANAVTDPVGADTGSGRVVRGGSWYDYPRSCRSADRYLSHPSFRNDYVGFRLALPSGQQRAVSEP